MEHEVDRREAERVHGAGHGCGRLVGGVEGTGRLGAGFLERHLAGLDEVLEGVEDAAVDDLPERVRAGRGGRRRREALAWEVDGGGDESPGGEGREEASEGEGSGGEAREDEHGMVLLLRGVDGGAGGDGEEVGVRVELEDAAVGEVAAEERREGRGGVGREEVGEEEREE